MIFSLCNSCLHPFQLLIEPQDVPLVKQIASDDGTTCPCPRLCGGAINLVGEPTIKEMSTDARLKEPTLLTGKQLYQAVMGLGVPDELPKDAAVIDSIFRANQVMDLNLEEHQGKVYLHEIRFNNGIAIHLASGMKGAQILRVSKERKNG